MLTAIVVEAFSGPPPVITQTMSNSCRAPMTERKIDTRSVGPSSGSVMYRNACQRPAPSISAASSISLGMPCSPASSRIMWNPKYFQEMITKSVIITMSVLPSQSWMRPLETDGS